MFTRLRATCQIDTLATALALICASALLALTPSHARDAGATDRAEINKKFEELSQKTEMLEAKRVVELKALDEKLGLTKDISDLRKDVSANAQKSIDWWFAGLAVVTAFFSIFIPFVFTWKLRSEYRAHVAASEAARKQIEDQRSIVDELKNRANNALGAIEENQKQSGLLVEQTKQNLNLIQRSLPQSNTAVKTSFQEQTANDSIKHQAVFVNVVDEDAGDTAELIAAASEIEISPFAAFADRLYARGFRAFEQRDYATAVAMFKASLIEAPENKNALYNLGVSLAAFANTANDTRAMESFREAASAFESALEIEPNNYKALLNWGVALRRLAGIESGAKARALLLEAIAKYEAVLTIKPNEVLALNSWGIALGQLADQAVGNARQQLRKQEIDKYEAALAINANRIDILTNLGVALWQSAEDTNKNERPKLLRSAIAKFETALKIKANQYDVLINWGAALSSLADTEEGEQLVQLLREAFLKYEAAIQINPEADLAFHNWGLALHKLADVVELNERPAIYLEAISKYATAVKLNSNLHDTLNAQSSAFLHLAEVTEDPTLKTRYIAEAESKAIEYEQRTGHPSYNLACVAARRSDAKRFVEVIDRVPQKDVPEESDLRADPDLDSIRKTSEFGDWWRKRFENEP